MPYPPPPPRPGGLRALFLLLGGSLFTLTLAGLLFAACAGPRVQQAVTGSTAGRAPVERRALVATVTRVADGDTFTTREVGTVRLIGVDTPETVKPGTAVQCYGPEASAHLKATLRPGQTVRLVYEQAGVAGGAPDPRPSARIDPFDRVLVYVYLTDGQFLNRQLVADGYARARYYSPNDDHRADFAAAMTAARAERRGGWAACPDFGNHARP